MARNVMQCNAMQCIGALANETWKFVQAKSKQAMIRPDGIAEWLRAEQLPWP